MLIEFEAIMIVLKFHVNGIRAGLASILRDRFAADWRKSELILVGFYFQLVPEFPWGKDKAPCGYSAKS